MRREVRSVRAELIAIALFVRVGIVRGSNAGRKAFIPMHARQLYRGARNVRQSAEQIRQTA